MKRTKAFLHIAFLLIAIEGFAQEQSATLYNMSLIPGRTFINPAFQPEAKLFIGAPGFSQLNIEFTNSGFAFNDVLIKTDTGYLVSPDQMLSKMPAINQQGMGMHLRPMAFGFRFIKRGYFTFDISQRVGLHFYSPKDFYGLFWKGNADPDYLGKRVSFDKMGIEFLATTEASIGYSHRFGESFTLGVRAKALFGMANITTTKNSKMGFTTDADDFRLSVDLDYQANISFPLVDYDSLFASGKFDFDGNALMSEGYEYLMNNRGYSFDLGASWLLWDRFQFSAAVTDIGYIDWNGNPANLLAKGTFSFEGFDITPYFSDDKSWDELGGELMDSLKGAFSFETTQVGYRQWLNPTVYAGFGIVTFGKDQAAVLLRNKFYKGIWYPKLTLSYNLRLGRVLNLAASYGLERGSFANIGVGMGLKLGPMQYFIVTDNALAFVDPFSAKTFNVVTGLNFLFGTKPKKASTSSL